MSRLPDGRTVGKPRFQFTCVDAAPNSPRAKVLEHVIDRARPIKRAAFVRAVDASSRQELERRLGYETNAYPTAHTLRMSQDWHVRYYSSRLPDGRPAYYLVWSAYEFVFHAESGDA